MSRLEGRRELQDARRQMKQMDAERAQLVADIDELQSRLARDEERENECRKEISALKQKVHLLVFAYTCAFYKQNSEISLMRYYR